jgi:hypothetical protein
MKTSELFPSIFGLIVRCVGLSLALTGLNQIYTVITTILQGSFAGLLTNFLYGIPLLLLGIWFLSGAKQLVSFSYPEEQQKNE